MVCLQCKKDSSLFANGNSCFVLDPYMHDICTIMQFQRQLCSLPSDKLFTFTELNRNENQREKMYHINCAPSKDLDEAVHPRFLIRVFAVRLKKPRIFGYPKQAQ